MHCQFLQLLGLGLLIPGILVIINDDGINEKVLPALQTVDFGVSNFGDLAKGLSITLIVMGSFVLVLSLLGGCGACCEAKLLLTIYSIVVVILFIGKLVIVILWIVFKADVESKLKAEMKTGLLKFTNDDLTTDEVSTGWNYLNMNLECCGIDAVTDTGADNDYTGSAWYVAGEGEIPISCCPSATSSSYTASTCSFSRGSTPTGQHSKETTKQPMPYWKSRHGGAAGGEGIVQNFKEGEHGLHLIMDEFYLFVNSGDSLDLFPENRGGQFSVRLPRSHLTNGTWSVPYGNDVRPTFEIPTCRVYLCSDVVREESYVRDTYLPLLQSVTVRRDEMMEVIFERPLYQTTRGGEVKLLEVTVRR
ncbi:Hypothetical predicted protein [Mytilus galloprovincialis]|uniref:Tetraspanin n=2 Tax=Mytilus galloprovincialis TaxID=29158 RepID=A0A8B6DKB2_MYTGA|nr:Hypothetical predicted protein [Mytilus galloprovincialis]